MRTVSIVYALQPIRAATAPNFVCLPQASMAACPNLAIAFVHRQDVPLNEKIAPLDAVKEYIFSVNTPVNLVDSYKIPVRTPSFLVRRVTHPVRTPTIVVGRYKMPVDPLAILVDNDKMPVDTLEFALGCPSTAVGFGFGRSDKPSRAVAALDWTVEASSGRSGGTPGRDEAGSGPSSGLPGRLGGDAGAGGAGGMGEMGERKEGRPFAETPLAFIICTVLSST